jgi:hypothetical protein
MRKPCAIQGCQSGKPPVWCPVLVLYARVGTMPARARMSLRLCDDCRATTALADLMSDAGWRALLSKWPSVFEVPDRTLTELDWDFVELEDDPMDLYR